jgi:hypothetical protein
MYRCCLISKKWGRAPITGQLFRRRGQTKVGCRALAAGRGPVQCLIRTPGHGVTILAGLGYNALNIDDGSNTADRPTL